MHSLALFHRIAGQPVIVLGKGDAAAAKRRLVERAGGAVADEEAEGARLAFVAMDEPEAAAARLKARGLLVNVADRPDLCDFTVPSLLERGAVVIAVGTGGVSAGLAKSLRLRLEAVLPQSLGALADALGGARDGLRARWPDPGERRRALDAALADGGALDPLDVGSAARFDAWLSDAETDQGGLVEIVLASTDPDDLTLRQARWLGTADLVLHDADIPAAVLARSRADAVRRVLAESESATATAYPGLTVVIRSR
jgi:uroporphyrin-III C-methyltransferase / precorrin-2 dehydrogenase / sirohydrochlorin ferrochelatase